MQMMVSMFAQVTKSSQQEEWLIAREGETQLS
jgi:hypothetical protein